MLHIALEITSDSQKQALICRMLNLHGVENAKFKSEYERLDEADKSLIDRAVAHRLERVKARSEIRFSMVRDF